LPVPSPSLHEFDSISERVLHVDAIESFERFIRDRRKPGSLTTGCQFREAPHQERGVGLSSGMKIRIHSEVKPKSATPEPCPASPSQIPWLRFLDQAKHAGIKRSGVVFLADGDRKLDVMKVDNFAHGSIRDKQHEGS
jgi:hypothetical protein